MKNRFNAKKPLQIANVNLSKIRGSIKNATDFEITVIIKGSFLVNNDLVDAWKELRRLKKDFIIDKDFEDTISIYQAESLGIIKELF